MLIEDSLEVIPGSLFIVKESYRSHKKLNKIMSAPADYKDARSRCFT